MRCSLCVTGFLHSGLPLADSRYIHGSSEEEQARLERMNAILNERELAAIGLRGDERALELGAGTGIFARALAARLPRGSVLGIERDERQIAAAARAAGEAKNLELRRGDVLEPPLLEGEWGSFDLVHARFLLEHLTAPLAAVRIMVRAARPLGRIVLVDDDHATLRIWPEAHRFLRVWRAYCDQYALRGMDPWIGRRLVGLLAEAGARPVSCSMLFFGACAGMEVFPTVVENMAGILEGAREAIVASGALGEADVRRGLDEAREWAKGRDATLWYALPCAEGTKS